MIIMIYRIRSIRRCRLNRLDQTEPARSRPMPGTHQDPRLSFRHAAVVLFLTGAIAHAASADIIYANGFEGFALLGGSISGTAWIDPDGDGDPTDGQPLAGKTIYLDADYDGVFDEGEPTVI